MLLTNPKLKTEQNCSDLSSVILREVEVIAQAGVKKVLL